MQAKKNSTIRAASRLESLETRRMLVASLPVDLVAIADDGTQQGNTPRSILFYDVNSIKTAGSTGNAFATPLFSIWTGYEVTVGTFTQGARNYEDFVSIDFSDDGKTGYLLAFDSVTSGSVTSTDSVGDTFGDYDLYRLNVLAAYNDFVANNREPGVMYAPRYSPDYNTSLGTGMDYIATYGSTLGPTGLPSANSTNDGIPQLEGGLSGNLIRDNTDASKANDIVFLDGVSAKVGEVARYTGASNPSIGFINEQEIQVVSDTKILLSERPRLNPSLSGGAADDWSIRTIERISTSPGAATLNTTTETGGSNGNTTESWEAFAWTGDNFLAMDPASGSSYPVSDFDGMRYIEKDGVKGVWISDRDGGGDDFSFFQLDFDTRVATKKEIPTTVTPINKSFPIFEDPELSTATADGDLDGFDLDLNGNIVLRESDFLTTPTPLESKFQTRIVTNYNAGDTNGNSAQEVTLGAWDTKARMTSPLDDDSGPLNTLNAVYSGWQNLMYVFDIDSGTGAAVDAYVYDMATETVIYSELNFANPLLRDGNRIRALRLGAVADSQPPTVTLSYNYLTEQSVTMTFSESVAASLAAGDLVLTNTTTSTVIPTADLNLTLVSGTTYKVTYKTGAASTPLPRGRYTLTLTAAGITDAAGNALSGPNSINFAYQPGDANNDGTVNFDDLLLIAQNYGTSGKNFAQGNLNYDAAGNVDFDDLLLLAQNYNVTLPALVAAKSSVVAPATAATKRKSVASSVL